MTSRTLFASAALAWSLLATAPALAQTHPDFGGIWEHTATSHGVRVPAPYTDKAKQLIDQDRKDHWHNGVSEENTFCLPSGMPFMMSGSEGFDISYNKNEMVIINEERPSPRHIYWDGRKHADPDLFDNTSVGNSIAHWEGDVLIVDTIGFLPGVTIGGVRSEKTHLVERYQLADKGAHLRITFTWDDPDLLTKPWTYEYLMDRAPKDRLAQEYYCDPRDPRRAHY
jgi:hypothetical protein